MVVSRDAGADSRKLAGQTGSHSEPEGLHEAVPLKGMRAAIAAAMMQSLHGTAQLTLHRRFNPEPLVAYRQGFSSDARPSLNDLVLAATARVLHTHPWVNATVEDDTIYRWRCVHLGMAVALDNGLVVPVIRNADRLTLEQLRTETARLGSLARQGRLKVSDIQSGTFTVTNLGHFGIDAFTPILNALQVAILGVGRFENASATLSLTIDHRALDGVPGANFLRDLSAALENPKEHL
ncbi:2-oxo acid dehydrogenase subunit E2 [Candidatus Protofrankia californiensis]|uniref:2-oxo acid dehydrogenase subunit E2 n=1 Tax=Candidatus Protofrankia californiensis TaxID=1839754 RepID=UPI00104158E4|nr:2-oxo acid dehydrogenase subunit E2 [Candidatus Protofrankia californiensis]